MGRRGVFMPVRFECYERFARKKRQERRLEKRFPRRVMQRDLLALACVECVGEGRVAWAVNLPRGGQRGSLEYQTCLRCRGTGREPG